MLRCGRRTVPDTRRARGSRSGACGRRGCRGTPLSGSNDPQDGGAAARPAEARAKLERQTAARAAEAERAAAVVARRRAEEAHGLTPATIQARI